MYVFQGKKREINGEKEELEKLWALLKLKKTEKKLSKILSQFCGPKIIHPVSIYMHSGEISLECLLSIFYLDSSVSVNFFAIIYKQFLYCHPVTVSIQ